MKTINTHLPILVIAATFVSCVVAVAEDSPITSSEISSDNSAESIALATKQGAETAKKDIKKEKFRILYYGMPWSIGEPLVDKATGYRVQIIGSCVVTAPFVAEVESYNHTMKQWHIENIRDKNPK